MNSELMLTPRETLHLATFLQLVGIDKVEREMLIDRTLDQLGLRHVESRRIGNPIIGPSGNIRSGSLSGGERRRLSVGTFKCNVLSIIQKINFECTFLLFFSTKEFIK